VSGDRPIIGRTGLVMACAARGGVGYARDSAFEPPVTARTGRGEVQSVTVTVTAGTGAQGPAWFT
jgi:hypothetical protein